LIGYLEQTVGVEEELGGGLEEAHDTDRVRLSEQSLAMTAENRHRHAEQHLRSLDQETVPDAQQSLYQTREMALLLLLLTYLLLLFSFSVLQFLVVVSVR